MGPPPGGSPASRFPDRRKARRYDISLPARVRPVPSEQSNARHGRTRDISTRGIYFIVDQEFLPGSELEFSITLPKEITQGASVFIHAHSRVVRAEESREDDVPRIGVAAVIETIDIIRAESPPV